MQMGDMSSAVVLEPCDQRNTTAPDDAASANQKPDGAHHVLSHVHAGNAQTPASKAPVPRSPSHVKELLQQWIVDHQDCPYLTEAEKVPILCHRFSAPGLLYVLPVSVACGRLLHACCE
mgnify:CR=1 FL=1